MVPDIDADGAAGDSNRAIVSPVEKETYFAITGTPEDPLVALQ